MFCLLSDTCLEISLPVPKMNCGLHFTFSDFYEAHGIITDFRGTWPFVYLFLIFNIEMFYAFVSGLCFFNQDSTWKGCFYAFNECAWGGG